MAVSSSCVVVRQVPSQGPLCASMQPGALLCAQVAELQQQKATLEAQNAQLQTQLHKTARRQSSLEQALGQLQHENAELDIAIRTKSAQSSRRPSTEFQREKVEFEAYRELEVAWLTKLKEELAQRNQELQARKEAVTAQERQVMAPGHRVHSAQCYCVCCSAIVDDASRMGLWAATGFVAPCADAVAPVKPAQPANEYCRRHSSRGLSGCRKKT